MRLQKLLSAVTISSLASMNVFSCLPLNTQQINEINYSERKNEVKAKIFTLEEISEAVIKYSYIASNPGWASNISSISNVNTSNLKENKTWIDKLGDPEVINQPKALYCGTSTLINNDDFEQILPSSEFNYTVSDTTSSSITAGIKGASKFSIPLIGETEITVSLDTTHATQKTTQYSLIAPRAEIKVPAHSKRYVKVLLNQIQTKITAVCNVEYTGTVSGKINFSSGATQDWSTNIGYGCSCLKAMGVFQEYGDVINYNDDLTSMIFKGEVKVLQAEHGTDYTFELDKNS